MFEWRIPEYLANNRLKLPYPFFKFIPALSEFSQYSIASSGSSIFIHLPFLLRNCFCFLVSSLPCCFLLFCPSFLFLLLMVSELPVVSLHLDKHLVILIGVLIVLCEHFLEILIIHLLRILSVFPIRALLGFVHPDLVVQVLSPCRCLFPKIFLYVLGSLLCSTFGVVCSNIERVFEGVSSLLEITIKSLPESLHRTGDEVLDNICDTTHNFPEMVKPSYGVSNRFRYLVPICYKFAKGNDKKTYTSCSDSGLNTLQSHRCSLCSNRNTIESNLSSIESLGEFGKSLEPLGH